MKNHQKQLKFNNEQTEWIKKRCFSEKDLPLFEKIIKINNFLNNKNIKWALIGGFAGRSYISSEYKEFILNYIDECDLDILVKELPKSVRNLLKMEIILNRKNIYSSEKKNELIVYHLREEYKKMYPYLDDVCIFEKKVGKFSFREDDFETMVNIKNPFNIPIIKFGILLAIDVDKDSILKKRAKRVLYGLKSQFIDIEEEVENFYRFVKNNGLERREVIKNLANMFNFIHGKEICKRIYDEFILSIGKFFGSEAEKYLRHLLKFKW